MKTLLIDVSNNQGPIHWQAVADHGVFGAYCKASEGTNFMDRYFATNRLQAHQAGLHVGGYHFARPDQHTPETEVEHFLGCLRNRLMEGELVPALDLEHTGHIGAKDAVSWARDFNHHFHQAIGVWPLFYSYTSFILGMGARTPIGAGLWLADYGADDGTDHGYHVPPPWKKLRLHQFTQKGHVPGVSGDVDLSHTTNPHGLVLTKDFIVT